MHPDCDRDLRDECSEACVLPLTGAAVALFVASTAGAAALHLPVVDMVATSVVASLVYGFALSRAHAARARIDREIADALRIDRLGRLGVLPMR